jgi:hypothetical protein
MILLTDPLFWLLAVFAVIALGLSKGDFSGVAMIAMPLPTLSTSGGAAKKRRLPHVDLPI